MKCPQCYGETEPDNKSCSCGWASRGKSTAKKGPTLCCYNDHGTPCHAQGHLSTGTTGAGPWYCRPHFARVMGWPVWEASAIKPTQLQTEPGEKG